MSDSQSTRRSFLETVALGSVGMALSSCYDSSSTSDLIESRDESSTSDKVGKIALQQWTFRDAIEENADQAFGRISEMGFDGIETAFWPENISLEQGAQLFKTHNISVVSVHAELPLGDEKDNILKMADLYECQNMVWHGWPEDERYHSYEGIHELAELYNESASWMKDQGFQLGLHNHWWEFEEVENQLPFYMLLDHIDEDIFFEIDTYWAKVAGQDPAQVIRDFGDRAKMLHMKDGAAQGTEGPMVALGAGVQDFPSILEASKGHVDWFIVEFDNCETDMFEAVKTSVDFLRGQMMA